LQTEYETNLKKVAIKTKERNLQRDLVSCMVETLNSKIKDTNAKILFDGDCNFDYIDSPIRFEFVLSNNPAQDDENFYVKGDEDVLFEGQNMKQMNFTEQQFAAECKKHEFKMMSNILFNDYYYRAKYQFALDYKPTNTKPWILKIDNWQMSDKAFLQCFGFEKRENTFTNIDEVEEFLYDLIRTDNELYNLFNDWKNGKTN
jgi:uncharacterized Zn ribbon protein